MPKWVFQLHFGVENALSVSTLKLLKHIPDFIHIYQGLSVTGNSEVSGKSK
jgi:hypothetical protein